MILTNKIFIRGKKGLTLVEALVSIFLLSALLVSILGAFYISKTTTIRAKHRMEAMGIVKEYMEQEISSGYYYAQYFTFASADPVTRTIDGMTYSITPYPYPPTVSSEGGVSYKLIGFRVSWTETVYGPVGGVACNEKAVTFVAQH